MINFDNVPNQEFSGVSDEELVFFSNESNQRYLKELDHDFLKEFEDFPADVDADTKALMNEDMVCKSTAWNTSNEIKHLKTFLSNKKLSSDIETIPTTVLAEYLRFYYYSLQKNDGTEYAPVTLIGKRAAIHRYLTSSSVNRPINILTDREFNRANKMLQCKVGKSIQSGKKSNKFDGIEAEDLKKMQQYLDDKCDPKVLQQNVWFHLSFKLGLRGRELHHKMEKSWIGIENDALGRKYAFIKTSYLSKNVRASLRQKEFENLSDGRLYDDTDNQESCPIKKLELYLSAIEEGPLYPLPLKNYKNGQMNTWYSKKREVWQRLFGQNAAIDF